jgi:hypothetical protein
MTGHSSSEPPVGPPLQCPSSQYRVGIDASTTRGRMARESPSSTSIAGLSASDRSAAANSSRSTSMVSTFGKTEASRRALWPRYVPVSTPRSRPRPSRRSLASWSGTTPIRRFYQVAEVPSVDTAGVDAFWFHSTMVPSTDVAGLRDRLAIHHLARRSTKERHTALPSTRYPRLSCVE